MLHIAKTSCLQAKDSWGGCLHRLSSDTNPPGWQQLALAAASLCQVLSLIHIFHIERCFENLDLQFITCPLLNCKSHPAS